MMPIAPISVALSPDQEVKREAALKQMRELMAKMSHWVKYRLLTTQDRNNFIAKGFARDLVDNLVYFTQRCSPKVESNTSDHLMIGFTDAAFDPSIYACEVNRRALISNSVGCCAWCESLIAQNGGGTVSHYRPAYGYSEQGILYRSAYYELAYEQNNLIYACRECADNYKTDVFPVIGGKRMSDVSASEERAALVNPYVEAPRNFIRFNPFNGFAFAYDRVLKFYQSSQDKGADEVCKLLWQDPKNIPLQHDIHGNDISYADVNSTFQQWLSQQSDVTAEMLCRGQTTIDLLGLNRPTLLYARNNHLRQLRGLFLAKDNQTPELRHEVGGITNLVDNVALKKDKSEKIPQYQSLTLDAINTWLAEEQKDQQPNDASIAVNTDNTNWISLYDQCLQAKQSDYSITVSSTLRSSLMYMVIESELKLENKRRIINLHVDDLLYGNMNAKCIFLQINWHKDFHNVIKVCSIGHIWETSFAELAETTSDAVRSLFAHNEIWAEGHYEKLA